MIKKLTNNEIEALTESFTKMLNDNGRTHLLLVSDGEEVSTSAEGTKFSIANSLASACLGNDQVRQSVALAVAIVNKNQKF